MPKFNANLTMLFTEVDFLERFELAAKNGFDAIEYLFPYEWSAAELADSLAKHDLKQVLHNLPGAYSTICRLGIAPCSGWVFHNVPVRCCTLQQLVCL